MMKKKKRRRTKMKKNEEDNDYDDVLRSSPIRGGLNPVNLPPPDSDTESEDMAVAPTSDDHEQEAEADIVGTITRVPYSVCPFSGTVYVGSGPSRQVFAPGPTGRDVNTLHRQWDLLPFRNRREILKCGTTAPVAHVDRADPDDPSPRPTRRPRHDDPYVMVRDAATRNEGDDAATTSDPQPSQPPGSPHYHLIMPPRAMTQSTIEKLVSNRVAATLAQDRATRGNINRAGGPGGNIGGNAGGQGGAPPASECTHSNFMKCNPTSFYGNEGTVELSRWFEKTESVFSISEYAERNKVANAKSWNDMKIMMREEFCPPEEIQRMEVKLWNLRLKDSNISAYTQRFNELVLLCPEMVPSEKKKVEAYLRGLPENIKGETTSSRPVVLNEAVRMAHTLMEQKL
ncbi:putative reverse transcriptase domain-containing protein [Tanacetum coccineum]